MIATYYSRCFKGEFLVIDPVFIYPEYKWDYFCKTLFENPKEKFFEEDKLAFYLFFTDAEADTYPIYEDDQQIGECYVDTGIIGIFPLTLVEKWIKINDVIKSLGTIIDIKQCNVMKTIPNDDSGNGFVGSYQILTTEQEQ